MKRILFMVLILVSLISFTSSSAFADNWLHCKVACPGVNPLWYAQLVAVLAAYRADGGIPNFWECKKVVEDEKSFKGMIEELTGAGVPVGDEIMKAISGYSKACGVCACQSLY